MLDWLKNLINVNVTVNKTVRLIVEPQVSNKPGNIYLLLRKEEMADILVYDVLLPAAGVDVESRELTVTELGTDQPVINLSVDEVSTQIRVKQDADVLLSLVDIDDAENRSEPSTFSFVAVDNLPPAKPGELGVTLVSEEETPAPEPQT